MAFHRYVPVSSKISSPMIQSTVSSPPSGSTASTSSIIGSAGSKMSPETPEMPETSGERFAGGLPDHTSTRASMQAECSMSGPNIMNHESVGGVSLSQR